MQQKAVCTLKHQYANPNIKSSQRQSMLDIVFYNNCCIGSIGLSSPARAAHIAFSSLRELLALVLAKRETLKIRLSPFIGVAQMARDCTVRIEVLDMEPDSAQPAPVGAHAAAVP